MPTLTESLTHREHSKASNRTDAWRSYRELLARRAAPADGDLDSLAELQERLGKADDDVRADISLLDRQARLNQDLDKIQVLMQKLPAVQEKATAYRTKLDALEREQKATMDGLERDHHRLGSEIQRMRANQPERELHLLRGEHRDLFGIEPPKPVEPPPKPAVPTRAETKAEELRRKDERITSQPGFIPVRQEAIRGGTQTASIADKPAQRVRSADNAA